MGGSNIPADPDALGPRETFPGKLDIKPRSELEELRRQTVELQTKCRCIDLYNQKSVRAD